MIESASHDRDWRRTFADDARLELIDDGHDADRVDVREGRLGDAVMQDKRPAKVIRRAQ